MPRKNKRKNASIQLSMGFLVTMIISIVIFILSLMFLTDFFKQANELKMKLDDNTRSQIETLLAGNARVAIPIETKTIDRGEPVSFGIGIKNTMTSEYFKLGLTGSKFLPVDNPSNDLDLSCDSLNVKCTVAGMSGEVYYNISRNGKTKIGINKKDTMIIAFLPGEDAPRGHYIFNVYICTGSAAFPSACTSSNLYDSSTHKLHLNVN